MHRNLSTFGPPSPTNSSPSVPPPEIANSRKSFRIPKMPSYLKDFHCNAVSTSNNNFTGVSYSLSYVTPVFHFLICIILSISLQDEATTYKQAVHHPQWISAMNSELEALKLNNTWLNHDLPNGKTPIGCKWVFKIKYNVDGSIERHKARLVTKGFT